MREIKFRAWDEENGVIREHFTIESIDGEPFDNQGCAHPEWKLMQYTGLKDKNGKEIYEGDIVRGTVYEYNGNFPVLFDGGAFSVQVSEDYTPCLYEGMPEHNLKIIGNIYETPELISA